MKRGLLIVGNVLGIRTGTIVKADTPSVFGGTGSDVCGSSVSTAGPPSVVSGLGSVIRAAGAGTIGQRNVWDVDSFKLLHPDRHLVGEES